MQCSPSGREILLARLRRIRSSLVIDKALDSDTTPGPVDTKRFDSVIASLESLVHNPPSLPSATAEVLDRLNIVRKGVLFLHPELHKAITVSRTLGSDRLWSNDNMYNHLSFLTSSFTTKNQVSFRPIIDTFFFRSAAMVPPPQRVVVMLENAVYPRVLRMDTFSGIFDYTAIVAGSSAAECYIDIPPEINHRIGDKVIAFFTAEARPTPNAPLKDQLLQVILELVACAERLGKSHIRGALTTGFEWHFVVVDLDADGDGAEHWVSEPIGWEWKTKRGPSSWACVVEKTSDEFDPALIAGILSSWIPNSFDKFDGDQWFVLRPEVDVVGHH